MTYNEVVGAISQFYNTNADNVWRVINDYNLTPEQAFDLVPNPNNYFSSGYGTVNFANGVTASWNNYAQLPVASGSNPLDSNAGTITQTQYQIPTSSDFSGTNGVFNGGQQLTGVPQGKVPIMTQVATGIAAAGLGIQLGKIINKTAYDNGFNWLSWAGVDMQSLNPATWDSITVDMSDTGFEGLVKRAFNAIFTMDENGSQMYIDQNAAAYLAMYMDMVGMFAPTTPIITPSDDLKDATKTWLATYFPNGLQTASPPIHYKRGSTPHTVTAIGTNVYTLLFRSADTRYLERVAFFSENPFSMDVDGTLISASSISFTGKDEISYQWYTANESWYSDQGEFVNAAPINIVASSGSWYQTGRIAEVLKFGTKIEPSSITGIDNQDGATFPNFSGALTPSDYLNLLQSQYPDLFNNAITQTVAQPDGTAVTNTYIPVGTPTATSTSDNQPTTDPNNAGQSQTTPTVDPATAPNPLIEGLVNIITNLTSPTTPPPTNPADTGEGNTPPAVIPSGSANALYSIYNPTQGELNSFGAWLWSSNFVDQLLKLFNDPMQAIIGLHKVFAPPVISGASTIKVGYLDSNVSSNVVGNQYTSIDCGSVDVSEYFGNVFDYDPFTQIYVYLPFVGIEKLDIGDVMRGRVGVKYHVDVLTGACLAEISITRDGSGGILYTFAGNCAVQYPISSGSYMGIVASLASIAGGVVGTVASGGALAPVAMGAVGGIMNAHTRVNHSGAFSGNAGAMGVKIPYLIITRPQTCLADNFPSFDGYPANKNTTLSACSGFVKCETCHVENIPATDAELSEIEMLLKGGIII